jgi:hypothetical protein
MKSTVNREFEEYVWNGNEAQRDKNSAKTLRSGGEWWKKDRRREKLRAAWFK